MNLIQNFGRDIIQITPEVVKTVKGEAAAHRDPYLDKWLYWTATGGWAEADARDHKTWAEDLTADEKTLLARMQADGRVKAWKPKYLRPWTGAWRFQYQRLSGQIDEFGNSTPSQGD